MTNLQAQYMDVWCEAFCCRHIGFKTVFQSASERHFHSKKFLGTQPFPQTPPQSQEGQTSHTHPLLTPLALNPRPPCFQNHKYATGLSCLCPYFWKP